MRAPPGVGARGGLGEPSVPDAADTQPEPGRPCPGPLAVSSGPVGKGRMSARAVGDVTAARLHPVLSETFPCKSRRPI